MIPSVSEILIAPEFYGQLECFQRGSLRIQFSHPLKQVGITQAFKIVLPERGFRLPWNKAFAPMENRHFLAFAILWSVDTLGDRVGVHQAPTGVGGFEVKRKL